MLKLENIADVFTGVPIRDSKGGAARVVRLSDLSDLRAGRNPILSTGEPPAVARALTIANNDVIVGARGITTDACAASNSILGAYVSLDLYLIRPKQGTVNSKYLAAFLGLPETQALFAGGKQGSSLARLPKDVLENTPIPLPPLHVQKQIAELASLFQQEDNLLKKLTALNSTLARETLARAIHVSAQQIPKEL